jgi:CRP-like cAMP-binding protein
VRQSDIVRNIRASTAETFPCGSQTAARQKAHPTVDQAFRSRLLDGLDAKELEAVLCAAKEQRFTAHSVIFDQTQWAERMFLLTHGRARYFFVTQAGQRILLQWLVPGDVGGGRALLANPVHYYVSLEVLKDSRFLVWDRPTLHHLTTSYPKFLRNALLIADDYLGLFLTAHIALTCFTARRRCASVLNSIALTIGHKVEAGIEVEITNEELADASATSLFETSRFVSDWRRSGIVLKKRGKILVRSLSLLAQEIQK